MAFWCDGGLPLPGVCIVVRRGCHQGDIVGGRKGVVGRGAEVHLELRPLLFVTGRPDRAHLIRQHTVEQDQSSGEYPCPPCCVPPLDFTIGTPNYAAGGWGYVTPAVCCQVASFCLSAHRPKSLRSVPF